MKTLVKQIDTTGSTGSATGTADLQAHGERLVGVQVRYAAGQPATTDVTLTNGPRTLLTLTNANTDRIVQPQVLAQDAAGTDTTDRVTPVVDGAIHIAVAQADAAQSAVTVKLFLEA